MYLNFSDLKIILSCIIRRIKYKSYIKRDVASLKARGIMCSISFDTLLTLEAVHSQGSSLMCVYITMLLMETTDACDWCSSIVELHYETTKALTGVKQIIQRNLARQCLFTVCGQKHKMFFCWGETLLSFTSAPLFSEFHKISQMNKYWSHGGPTDEWRWRTVRL